MEIEIDPLVARAFLGAAEALAVEGAATGQVGHRESQMEWV
jgi:hypothetical protein